jgi:AcrR family transcriptional regulator
MRSRAWQGDPPRDDDDARDRIISAAMRCIDRHGPTKTSLSDVASELGVTRQTVYRLFASTDELFQAVSISAADTFVSRMAARVSGLHDPAQMLVECLAYTVEHLLEDRYLSLLLVPEQSASIHAAFVSAIPANLTGQLLDLLPVDWMALRLDKKRKSMLVEIYLRTLQSFLVDPGPRRSPRELRAFLEAWFAPSARLCIEGDPALRR